MSKETHTTLNLILRPKNLSEMIGNEKVVKSIQAKLDSGDVPPAFLFSGPFGTGKTTLAYIVARLVQGFDFPESREPQIQEINAAEFTGVDDMRALVQRTGTVPLVGKYRVIVLDEAHKLSRPAQELLLKEFENTSKPCVWIICTTETAKLNKGLLTRCLKYETRGLTKKEIVELVKRAATSKERTAPYDDFLTAIGKSGITSPRSILTAFETYNDGLSAEEAVTAGRADDMPEFHEIGLAVAYGKWSSEVRWQGKGGAPDTVIAPVRELLEKLDLKIKRNAKKNNEEDSDAPPAQTDEQRADDVAEVEKEDTIGRNEVARGLRAVIAAFLKGKILSPRTTSGSEILAYAEALDILVKSAPQNEFDVPLEFPATIGAIARIMVRLAKKNQPAA